MKKKAERNKISKRKLINLIAFWRRIADGADVIYAREIKNSNNPPVGFSKSEYEWHLLDYRHMANYTRNCAEELEALLK